MLMAESLKTETENGCTGDENNFMLNYDICKMNCELFLRMNGRKRNTIESVFVGTKVFVDIA